MQGGQGAWRSIGKVATMDTLSLLLKQTSVSISEIADMMVCVSLGRLRATLITFVYLSTSS